ncbi:Di-copper centre-containing protein [Stipitochalara longipes BDJ]|nr:Di-copper centre-containing protein [Stipitochalara longipes BDJ]
MSLYRGVVFLASIFLLFSVQVSADAVSDLQDKGRAAINAELAKSKTCTAANLKVRKEWGNVTVSDRKAYIKAVLCLFNSPSKLPAGVAPGAKNRYDDFIVTHITQTLNIHGTGSFLSWHRYFTWSYEQALINECGYNGTQPYWDWGRWAANPETSPIFDGTDTSMSGNGQKVQHAATFNSPAQNGGGCVQTGPFKNISVNLGPISPVADPAPPKNPLSTGLGYNPRCLRRDLGPYLTTRYTTTAQIAALITGTKAIGTFQDTLQGGTGLHGSAHFTIGSDPGGDFYNSPGDPAFWLLHSMIDRVWYIWQTQDLTNRMQVIAGQTNMFGGGAISKLTDNINITYVNKQVLPMSSLMSTVDGPFCYVYE